MSDVSTDTFVEIRWQVSEIGDSPENGTWRRTITDDTIPPETMIRAVNAAMEMFRAALKELPPSGDRE